MVDSADGRIGEVVEVLCVPSPSDVSLLGLEAAETAERRVLATWWAASMP